MVHPDKSLASSQTDIELWNCCSHVRNSSTSKLYHWKPRIGTVIYKWYQYTHIYIYIYICVYIYIYISRYIPMISLNISPLKKQFDGWFTEAWWHLPPGERSFTTPVFVAWWMIGADVISWDLTMEVWWNVGFHGILGFYEIETFLKVGFSEMLTGCRWT